MQRFLRPEIWLISIMDQVNELKRKVSDEIEYEDQYAFGNEIFNDFNYNVGRKIHIIKSSIKVVKSNFIAKHMVGLNCRSGLVLLVLWNTMKRSFLN